MGDFSKRSKIIITCMKRLAPFLRQEVEALGYPVVRHFQTGLEMEGTLADCIRLNLNLRCAGQVLYALKSFRVQHVDNVYDTVLKMPWENWMAAGGYVSVTSHVNHFTINNPLFVNVKVKDAIADRFRRETGSRPNSGPKLDRTVVHLYWHEDLAEVFLDTSGETLAKHGYRKIPGRAPMLEALAAATVYASRWDRATSFVNPMCGSGTLAIEAACMATRRVPGLLRTNFAFMHLLGYDASVYEQELDAIRRQVTDTSVRILATDLDADAVMVAQVNARAAGVAQHIEFRQCDFQDTPLPQPPGVLFFNPEYGERLGESVALENTYAAIGDFMKKKAQGYTGYVFTGNLELAKKIGLRASRRVEFYNGTLDCRLLEYELYAGTKRIA